MSRKHALDHQKHNSETENDQGKKRARVEDDMADEPNLETELADMGGGESVEIENSADVGETGMDPDELPEDTKAKKKSFKMLYRHGNYPNYYGYRREGDVDVRLGHLEEAWFREKTCLDIGCNSGALAMDIGRQWRRPWHVAFPLLTKRLCPSQGL